MSAPGDSRTMGRRGISIARARELLGDDGAHLTDEQVAACIWHAEAMALELIDLYLAGTSDRAQRA